MSELRRPEVGAVHEALEDHARILHIYGEPGIGKTVLLEQISDSISDSYRVSKITVREGYNPTTLTQDILYQVRQNASSRRGLSNKITGLSGTISIVGFGIGGGFQTDDRARGIQRLAELSKDLSTDKEIVILIDDVQKIDDDPEVVRDYLDELQESVDDGLHFITCGRLPHRNADWTMELDPFTEQQTEEFLKQRFPGIDAETVKKLHEALDGQPYFLGLVSETPPDADSSLQLEEDDFYRHIEQDYLNSLTQEEEEFLVNTAPLTELDEASCSAILDISRTEARRTLDSLRNKVIVRELDQTQTGTRVFKIHDKFRQVLYDRLEDPGAVHRAAFQFYAKELYEQVEDSDVAPLLGFGTALLARAHLHAIYGEEISIPEIQKEIDQVGLDLGERFDFVLGYAPYAFDDDLKTSKLLVSELDLVREKIKSKNEEGPQLVVRLVSIDIMRGYARRSIDNEVDTPGLEILDQTITRIEEFEWASHFDDEIPEEIRYIPDVLKMFCLAAAIKYAKEEETRQEYLDDALDILAEYGLDKEIGESWATHCEDFLQDLDLEPWMEEMIWPQVEAKVEELLENTFSRARLYNLQEDVFEELMETSLAILIDAMRESERLVSFIDEGGKILKQAENPIFAAFWYGFVLLAYERMIPQADVTGQLEENYEEQKNRRKEYEREHRCIVEIEEIEENDFEFPVLPELRERGVLPEQLLE